MHTPEVAVLTHDGAVGTSGFPPVLKRFCLWVAAMTLLSEAWSAALSLLFRIRPPYGGTFSWYDAGQDFLIFAPRFLAFRTPHFWDAAGYPFTYPAPLGVVYWLIYKLPHGVTLYLLFSIAVLLIWAFYFAQRLATHGLSRTTSFLLLTLFLASAWPVRFLLQTGNMEMLVALILGVGVVAATRGRWWLAATCIGLAGSMKLYPLILLGLLLSQRRYKQFFAALAIAALATIASLAILGPSIPAAQQHIAEGLHFVAERYVLAPVPYGLQFSHSLFNLVKIAVVSIDHLRHPDLQQAVRAAQQLPQMQRALQLYIPLIAAAGLLLYLLRIRHLPLLNQTLALTVCAVLLPPFSLDYTLVQLLVPFGLLCVFALQQWRQGHEPPGLTLCFLCFAVLFTTGAYFEVKYRFAAQVRTLALIVLLAAVMHFRFNAQEESPA